MRSLIATGVSYRKLDAPGCEELAGAGVYYGAAATEALATAGQDVFVVGGGNSAGQAAMYLAGFARHVTVLVRGNGLAESMSRYLIDQIREHPEHFRASTRTRVTASSRHGKPRSRHPCGRRHRRHRRRSPLQLCSSSSALRRAPTGWAVWLELDKFGFILTGPDLTHDGKRPRGWTVDRDPYWLESSVPGIFVAGDVRCQSVKRVASAVGEGAMAVQFIHRYLASL